MTESNIPSNTGSISGELRSWIEPHKTDGLDALLGRAATEIERQHTALETAHTKIQAIVNPWLGVRADILPPSIVALAPLLNELFAALQGETGAKHGD